MDNGFYRKKPIKWSQYEVDLFIPHLYSENISGSCGANALSLVVGIPPKSVHNTNRNNKNDWKDSFMIKFLKKHGFIVKQLTKCDVSNTGTYSMNTINDRHVLLTSQLISKNVASWAVIHNQLWYHNFQVCAFSGFTLVNAPTLTCYVVYHPSWNMKNWKIN